MSQKIMLSWRPCPSAPFRLWMRSLIKAINLGQRWLPYLSIWLNTCLNEVLIFNNGIKHSISWVKTSSKLHNLLSLFTEWFISTASFHHVKSRFQRLSSVCYWRQTALFLLSAKYIIRTHGKYYEQHYNKSVVCNQKDSYLLLL